VIFVGRPADHIRDAAATGMYWTVSPTGGGRWMLHAFAEQTGTFTDPSALSPVIAAGEDAADLAWTLRHLDLGDLNKWIAWKDGAVTRHIEETYRLVRDLRGPVAGTVTELSVEPRADAPNVVDAVARDVWPNGKAGPILTAYPYDEFHDDSAMLTHFATWLNIDPARWQEVGPGRYHHR
jgi:hypothetical protein